MVFGLVGLSSIEVEILEILEILALLLLEGRRGEKLDLVVGVWFFYVEPEEVGEIALWIERGKDGWIV